MTSVRTAATIKDAAAAAKAGHKEEARRILDALLADEPELEVGWMWRAAVSADATEAMRSLERVIRINPNNQKALTALQAYRNQQSEGPATGPTPAAETNGHGAAHHSQSTPAESTPAESTPAPVGPREPNSPEETPETGAWGRRELHPAAAPVETPRMELAPRSTPGPVGTAAVQEPESSGRGTIANDVAGRMAAARAAAEARMAAEAQAAAEARLSGAIVAETRRCPFCATHLADHEFDCPTCRAVLDLNDVDRISKHPGVDERAVAGAMQTALTRLKERHSPELYLTLALGYLNLKASTEALPFLEVLARVRPQDSEVRQAVLRLQSRRLVMAVDDSTTIRKILAVTLERALYRAAVANSGEDALQRLHKMKPDLILLDITLPGMDGYQVCRAIRQTEGLKTVPVVMLSGKDGFFDKVKGKMAGATTYLTKPFDPHTLLDNIAKLLPGSGGPSGGKA